MGAPRILCGCVMNEIQERTFWSSSENGSTNAWNVNFNNGNLNNNNKFNQNRARAVAALQEITFDIPFESIIEAFFDCIRHKRTSPQCVEFCVRYLPKLVELWHEIRAGVYKPGESTCFLVNVPTWREIFAADFRDRIVHHWICLREIPLFEKRYAETGNISFNCRKDYGQFLAIDRLSQMIEEASCGYSEDCYIVELDIRGFFMSISKSLLWEMIEIYVRDNYVGDDIECLLYLHRVSLFNRPQKHCRFQTARHLWANIPKDKSLFTQPADRGIAIGNHTAQQEANFYNTALDYYIVKVLGLSAVRFVDDLRIVVKSKEEGFKVVEKVRTFLREQLLLSIHPKKIRVVHYKQGTKFVGAVLKDNRRYISNKTRGRLVNKIRYFNALADAGRAGDLAESFVATINSYYGMMRHFQAYTIRRKYAMWILERWREYLYFTDDFQKAVVKPRYKKLAQIHAAIRKGDAASLFTQPFLID